MAATVGVAVLALATGCGGSSGTGSKARAKTLTVYVSAPLQGDRAAAGRAIVNGAKLSLADAAGHVGSLKVRAVYLDDTSGGQWSLARTADNARRAVEDVTAIGYIGDLDSGATRASLPITNQAQMVQISPGSTAVDLTRIPPVGSAAPAQLEPSGQKTFTRVVPSDDVQAHGAALWAKRMGAKRVATFTDGSEFGRSTGFEFSQEASRLHLQVEIGRSATPRADLAYVAAEPDHAASILRSLERIAPTVPIIGPDAIAAPALLHSTASLDGRLHVTSPFVAPSLLPPQGQRFLHAYRGEFGYPADPAAAYGYESMALLLNAIKRAGPDGDDRSAVIDKVLSTRNRRSVLGTYSIDASGDTTLDTVSGYRVSDGLPVFPTLLRVPR